MRGRRHYDCRVVGEAIVSDKQTAVTVRGLMLWLESLRDDKLAVAAVGEKLCVGSLGGMDSFDVLNLTTGEIEKYCVAKQTGTGEFIAVSQVEYEQ